MSVDRWLSRLKNRTFRQKCVRRRDPVRLGCIRDWLLEDRCLLSANGPIALPAPTVSCLDKVFYNGVSGAYEKTITITNNSPTQTIYPILEGQNSLQAVSPYQGTGGYDPYDPVNQEYRGYIGYTDGTNKYAGLPPDTTIQITVPLVFWDSGRIIFSTDGADQFHTYSGNVEGKAPNPNPTGAPFYYLDANTQAIFYCTIKAGDNKLCFTPVYNSFGPDSKPTTANWKSPVASGLLKDGQQFTVTGPDGFSQVVTIDSSHPDYVSLPQAFPLAETAQQFVFSCSSPSQTISSTDRYIQSGFTLSPQGSPSTTNGLVMWYHALKSQAPNNDAPFQLTEITFRGTFYDPTINKGTGFQYLLSDSAYAGAITNSADYDISYVDSINMPVAMEATDALIPNTSTQTAFGWVGSGQSLAAFQNALVDFASNNKNGNNTNFLGTYFGGNGYPSYLVLDPGNIKLPSGQNVFLASPVAGGVADIKYYEYFPDDKPQPSSINAFQNALTSGPTGPTQLIIGGDGTDKSSGSDLYLSTNTQANVAMLKIIANELSQHESFDVMYNGNTPLGQVQSVIFQGDNPIGIVLKGATVPANAGSQVYTISLVQKDYAGSAIAGLWYSWAQYYANSLKSLPPVTNVSGIVGAITKSSDNSNVLTLTSLPDGAKLVPGMTVTGAGIPSGCVVLAVSSDPKTVTLSTKLTPNQQYTNLTFSPPHFSTTDPASNSIVGYDPNYTPLVPFHFTSDADFAEAFAQTVYVVMNAWSASVKTGPKQPPAWTQLLGNIIGGNLNSVYLPNANVTVRNILTDMSKSALRGVPDFTSPLYSNPSQWYPDPALPTGGQTYNVYNLDPFVWFIHDKLGITAYAFALDDDVGNVNAGGATNVAISVGGLTELPNPDPYTNTVPWGVATTTVTKQQNISSSTLANLNNPSQIVNQIAPFDYPHDTPGSLINGPGLPLGTNVQFTNINSNTPSLSTITLSNPLTADVPSSSMYSFFGPLVFTGTVLGKNQAANTIVLDSQDAYNTLLKLGPYQNIQVTGEGIDPTKTVTITNLSEDANGFTVTLSNPLDPNRVSQPGSFYAYTFGSPLIPLVRDPGFEWGNVQGLSGNFNHGTQLTQNTVDWTFADSISNTQWFAGIAANDSVYTGGDKQSAPQGLQVGFVQGDSRISQTLTLGQGTYKLTFDAAQSAANNNQTAQSLNVLLDGKSVGTIKPNGTTYQTFTIRFTVAAGTHTIAFQGTQSNDNTVLIDAVALSPSSLFGSPLPAGSPPPSSSPRPVGNPLPGSTLATIADLVLLVEDEFFMTLYQVAGLADLTLGIVAVTVLDNSIAAYQNTINANPMDHTLLGEAIIGLIHFDTIKILR